MADYRVSVLVDDAFVAKTDAVAIESQGLRVLAAEDVAVGSELSVAVTDDDTVRDLNRRFRGLDERTDVLSFASDEGSDFANPPGIDAQLGEVVISFPAALRQAQAAGRPVIDEVLHLLTHGILHIVGYDHETDDEEREMHAREEAMLEGWQH